MNAARPVNRLPPEILAESFSLATEYGTLDRLHPLTWQLDLTQIQRMHALPTVCRYWHDVALGTRSLWPIICTNTFKYRGRLMQDPPVLMHSPYPVPADYSGPLSLYFSDSYPLKAKELLEKYTIRTRELYLITGRLTGNFTEDVSTLLDTLETVPGDALEHFAMKMVFLDVFPRMLSLFSGGGAKLRSLAIDRVNFCPTNTFPALTHLVVSYAAWTPGTFLDLLSRCPRLEHAHLVWLPAVPMGPSVDTDRDPLPPGQRTKLPHAVRFTLSISAPKTCSPRPSKPCYPALPFPHRVMSTLPRTSEGDP
ncbi:hypothetical protein LXA43DRAFT_1021996 [Ganoderma leucocontextum]|nr:hypothetical protein LXA43DRAFT_1021996 [Ganoderma leucocontextum]